MSLKDDWRRVVLDFHEQGLTRTEIAALVPLSSAYVSQIVAEAGRTFPGTGGVDRATRGRQGKTFQRRLDQAERATDGATVWRLVGPELRIAFYMAIEEERANVPPQP